jgi:WD40 repeat protein
MIWWPQGSETRIPAPAAVQQYPATICSLAFSPDGRKIASADLGGDVRLWDRTSGDVHRIRRLRPQDSQSVVFSPDGRFLVVAAGESQVGVWNVDSGRRRAGLKIASSRCVAFSPDGRLLAATRPDDGAIVLWEWATRQERAVLRGHRGKPLAVAFAPDGRVLASGDSEGVIKLWEVVSGRERVCVQAYPSGFAIWSLAFSPDGSMLASASCQSSAALLWDGTTGRARGALRVPSPGIVTAMAFTPDGALLVLAGTDGVLRFKEPATGRERAALAVSGNTPRALAIAPDGRTLAAGGVDQKVQLWDLHEALAPDPDRHDHQ